MARICTAIRGIPLAIGCLCGAAQPALAKQWKGEETITQQTFKYGAFEARIRAAKGSGMITPFFLWKDGSEQPGAKWQEQDFEIFGSDGTFQTQVMTPGKDGSARTEHVEMHFLPTKAWERYYTYRMEWTPNYLAFYLDGHLIRKETDSVEFAKFLDPNQAEPAQLRTSMWAGDWSWSGSFDASAVPAAMFVNWIQAYSYTPRQGPSGSDFTLLWRDDFNSLSSSRWWGANWTFDAAVNDYVTQNAAAKSGTLIQVLTDQNATGRFPTPPTDDGQELPLAAPPPAELVTLPGRIEAESYAADFDTTGGNWGDAQCGSGDVDAEVTRDSEGGYCNIGWTDPGEWTEYDTSVEQAAEFVLTVRAASLVANQTVHVELNGVDVTGPLTIPALGWQTFSDLVSPAMDLDAGDYTARLVFDTGYANVNYLQFDEIGDDQNGSGGSGGSGGTGGTGGTGGAGGTNGTGGTTTCTPTTTTYEAENIAHTTGGGVPNGWNLWSNGNVSTPHAFAGGQTTIRVRAYGQQAAGVFPHMIVNVDGQKLGDLTVSSTAYAPYSFAFSASPGSHTIKVSFDNDYYQNGQDRNLYLDSIAVDECR